ncbi:MAG: lipoate--protein ligase family protein [Actinobacteria bacterium]|nr:MAG: lipoate--protein ligase family protein [Actinomycetota bacterium]
MSERWRFIDGGPTEAPAAYGRLPAIAASVVQGGPEVLMTLLWSRGHLTVGWFDDVDSAINLDAAHSAGIDVFRRPIWGGGTAFYDTEAVAVWSWIMRDDRFPSLDEALGHFRPVMERALADLGLGEARFAGSSDIRWRDRKLGTCITQAVLGTKVVGGFLNLKRPDLELYRRVARVPEEKFKDKVIKDIVEYICTPADIRGTPVGYAELRDAVARASREVAGLELDPTPYSADEHSVTDQFVAAVRSDDFVRRISSERFRAERPAGSRVGFANVKGKKLVRAGVALDALGTISRAMIAGDMHVSPPDAMDRVAAGLAGASAADREDILGRVRAVFDAPDVEQADAAAGITPEDVVEAVVRAAKEATA